MCSRCRHKGTLACRLFQAEAALKSMQVQRDVYERLLQEKQQQIDNVSMEHDALPLEKKELETRLEDARREIDSLKIDKLLGSEQSVTIPKERSSMGSKLFTLSATRTASLRGNSDAWSPVALVPSSRRKLPQLPQSVESSSKAVVTTRSALGLPAGMVSTMPTVTTPVISGLIPYCRGDVGSRPSPLPTAIGETSSPAVLTATNSGISVTYDSAVFKQPPGFKDLRERVNKFAGDGKEDFEVWLADYCEATEDCGWTDQLRARWFSWFLTGAAKHAWQRTLNAEDKATWASIVQSYKGHYGVHVDPRSSYGIFTLP